MFLFLRLLLAHLTADFLLQTNGIFKIKVKYSWGVLLHGGIAGLSGFFFALPYLHNKSVIAFLIISWVVHIFQDKAKIIINLHVERNNLWTFLFDQFLHVSVAAVVAAGCDSVVRVPFPLCSGRLEALYANDKLVIAAIWVIVLTYGMFVLQEYIKKTIKGDKKEGVTFPGLLMKYYGIGSRAAIGLGIYLAGTLGWYAYILPVAMFVSGYLMVKNGRMGVLDYRISGIAAVLIGVLMRLTA